MRDISNGSWVRINSKTDFEWVKKYGNLSRQGLQFQARVQIGTWVGAGWYRVLQYSQRCPRGCCYDDVVEVVSAQDMADEFEEEIGELGTELRQAEQYCSEARD